MSGFQIFFFDLEVITFICSTGTYEIEAFTMSFNKKEKIEVFVMEK